MLATSHIFSAMANSVGGITYTRNRYGSIVGRAKAMPVNPSSLFQELMRTNFNASVAGFKGLTEAQRIAWTNFAKDTPWMNALGEDIRLTGQAMYIAQRSAAIDANPTVLPSLLDNCGCTPGLLPTPLVTTGCCTNPTVGGIITVQNQDSTLAMDFIVRISNAQNFSRTYWNGPYRHDLQILLTGVAAGATDDAEFCPLCLGRYFYEIRGFDGTDHNNMSTIVRGHFDACTDPI